MSIHKVSLESFEDEVLNSSKPSVVKFSHDGCHLCVELKPIYAELAGRYADVMNFFDVDTLKETKLTTIFSDDGVPTIYFFVNGDGAEIPYPEDEHSGYSKKSLTKFINDFIKGDIKIVKDKE